MCLATGQELGLFTSHSLCSHTEAAAGVNPGPAELLLPSETPWTESRGPAGVSTGVSPLLYPSWGLPRWKEESDIRAGGWKEYSRGNIRGRT